MTSVRMRTRTSLLLNYMSLWTWILLEKASDLNPRVNVDCDPFGMHMHVRPILHSAENRPAGLVKNNDIT